MDLVDRIMKKTQYIYVQEAEVQTEIDNKEA